MLKFREPLHPFLLQLPGQLGYLLIRRMRVDGFIPAAVFDARGRVQEAVGVIKDALARTENDAWRRYLTFCIAGDDSDLVAARARAYNRYLGEATEAIKFLGVGKPSKWSSADEEKFHAELSVEYLKRHEEPITEPLSAPASPPTPSTSAPPKSPEKSGISPVAASQQKPVKAEAPPAKKAMAAAAGGAPTEVPVFKPRAQTGVRDTWLRGDAPPRPHGRVPAAVKHYVEAIDAGKLKEVPYWHFICHLHGNWYKVPGPGFPVRTEGSRCRSCSGRKPAAKTEKAMEHQEGQKTPGKRIIKAAARKG